MEDFENIYDKIKELIGNSPERLSVLDEQIDIDVQMEYFEFSRRIKEGLDPKEVIAIAHKLLEPDYSLDLKKDLLPRLASVEKVEAYRILEKFMLSPPEELKNWCILALQESKLLLESKLLNENKVFVSTGLGGKGDKLRYFVVLIASGADGFTDLQKKIIRNEFEITLKKHSAVIEEITYYHNFVTLLTIVPMNVTIKQLFREAIEESNLFGDFLAPNFIITNVKILNHNEIRDFVNKHKSLKKKEIQE